jgi:hypothetical protein
MEKQKAYGFAKITYLLSDISAFEVVIDFYYFSATIIKVQVV